MRVYRNSHKLKIPLATTICGEGDFNFVYLASSIIEQILTRFQSGSVNMSPTPLTFGSNT